MAANSSVRSPKQLRPNTPAVDSRSRSPGRTASNTTLANQRSTARRPCWWRPPTLGRRIRVVLQVDLAPWERSDTSHSQNPGLDPRPPMLGLPSTAAAHISSTRSKPRAAPHAKVIRHDIYEAVGSRGEKSRRWASKRPGAAWTVRTFEIEPVETDQSGRRWASGAVDAGGRDGSPVWEEVCAGTGKMAQPAVTRLYEHYCHGAHRLPPIV